MKIKSIAPAVTSTQDCKRYTAKYSESNLKSGADNKGQTAGKRRKEARKARHRTKINTNQYCVLDKTKMT